MASSLGYSCSSKLKSRAITSFIRSSMRSRSSSEKGSGVSKS